MMSVTAGGRARHLCFAPWLITFPPLARVTSLKLAEVRDRPNNHVCWLCFGQTNTPRVRMGGWDRFRFTLLTSSCFEYLQGDSAGPGPGLGLAWFWLVHCLPTSLPRLMRDSQKGQIRWTRWLEHPKQSQPNPGPRPAESPCICSNKWFLFRTSPRSSCPFNCELTFIFSSLLRRLRRKQHSQAHSTIQSVMKRLLKIHSRRAPCGVSLTDVWIGICRRISTSLELPSLSF